MSVHLQLIEQADSWKAHIIDFNGVVSAVFAHLDVADDKQLAVVLSDDDAVRELNHQFRGKDKSTNVLSFPSDEPDEWGDVILAYGVIQNEAVEQNKRFEHHATHLVVHGVLHILGYDHIDDDDAREMESLEIAILAKLAIANPYENH